MLLRGWERERERGGQRWGRGERGTEREGGGGGGGERWRGGEKERKGKERHLPQNQK